MLTSAISVQEVPSQDSVFVTRVVVNPETAIEAGADVPRPMPCLLEVFYFRRSHLLLRKM